MNAYDTQSGGEGDPRPSLLIADDDAVVRSVLNAQLAGDFQIVGLATTVTEAIELASEHQPDAALIDVEMPDGGARAAVPQIVTRSPQTCIVILSGDESRDVVLELLTAGAMAYLRKGVPGAQISKTLLDALRAKTDPQRP
jgi:DNA-binding NarL/FixJ family response regulator